MSSWVRLIVSRENSSKNEDKSIGDNRVYRLIDEELRRASEDLNTVKSQLDAEIATQKQIEAKSKRFEGEAEKLEGYIVQALEKDETALAREVAEKVLDLEQQRKLLAQESLQLQVEIGKHRADLRRTERQTQRLKQQADTLHAAKNMQRAQLSLVDQSDTKNPKLKTAIDVVKAMKVKRSGDQSSSHHKAPTPSNFLDSELLKKLEDAGIVQSKGDVDELLQRIQRKYIK